MKKLYLYFSVIFLPAHVSAMTDAQLIEIARNCVEQNFKLYELKSPSYAQERLVPEIARAIEDLESQVRRTNFQIADCPQKLQLLAYIVDQKNILLLNHRMNSMDVDELRAYSDQLQTDLEFSMIESQAIKEAISNRIQLMHAAKRADAVVNFNKIDEAGLAFAVAKMKGAQLTEYRAERVYRQQHKLTMKEMALLPIARRILAKPVEITFNNDVDDDGEVTEAQIVNDNDNANVNPEFDDDTIPLFQPTAHLNGLSHLLDTYHVDGQDDDSDMDVG